MRPIRVHPAAGNTAPAAGGGPGKRAAATS